jgi:DNA-binding NtrC family response regulator
VLICNRNHAAVESDLIQRVDRKYPNVSILAVGFRSLDEYPPDALSKIDDYLQVPFDAEQLITSVRRASSKGFRVVRSSC